MYIAFMLARETYLKTMGTLIQAALNQGHGVMLMVLDEIESNHKGDQAVDTGFLEVFVEQGATVIRSGIRDLLESARGHGIDVIVTHEGYHTLSNFRAEIKQLRSNGTKVVSLPHFFEIAKRPLDALDYFDKTFYLSEFAMDFHFRSQLDQNDALSQLVSEKESRRAQYAITGSPMFDMVQRVNGDGARKKYGIKDEQKVVLLMQPVIGPNTPWRNLVWGQGGRWSKIKSALMQGRADTIPEILVGRDFKRIFQEIRLFCDQNDAYLIVKSRSKQMDPEYVRDGADLHLDGEDDRYFPEFVSYQLMAFSDLCVSANSMGILEAVAAGVPSINIYVPHKDFSSEGIQAKEKYYDGLMGWGGENPFNYQGCVTQIDRTDFIGWLSKKTFSDFRMDEERRLRYCEYYLGMTKESASSRILNVLKSLTMSRTGVTSL